MEEKKKQEWLMPQAITTLVTNEPKEMLNKYIAERVVKKWTEDYLDEETKEIITVERNELLFPAGLLIDQDLLVKLNFALQCGDISEVCVSDNCIQSQRNPLVRSYVVSVVDVDGKHDIYVKSAESIEEAAQIVTDYLSIYKIPSIVSNSFSVKETKVSNKMLLDKEVLSEAALAYLNDMANVSLNAKQSSMTDDSTPLPLSLTTEQSWYFKVTVWAANRAEKKWEKSNYTLLVMANFFELAIEYLNRYISTNIVEDNIWEINGVSKGSIEYVIPTSYIKSWKEKHNG